MSWDPTDNLWTTTGANDQIFVFRAGASLSSRQARPIEATVTVRRRPIGGLITALQIAPDGVRVAMIINSDELTFGAIVWAPGTGPGLGSVRIQLSPFNVSDLTSGFTAVTWYGPDNVITLGGPGSTLTEYPVNGGTSTSQMLDQTVESITASPGQALIAGVAKGEHDRGPEPDRRVDDDRDRRRDAGQGHLTDLPRLNRRRTSQSETSCRVAHVTFCN